MEVDLLELNDHARSKLSSLRKTIIKLNDNENLCTLLVWAGLIRSGLIKGPAND